jgi:hypothetical protein
VLSGGGIEGNAAPPPAPGHETGFGPPRLRVFLLDPMLATGGSGVMAIEGLAELGAPPGPAPGYGAVLDDPNFDIVGGLTYVGFAGRSLPGAPFAALPRGVHVQFRLAASESRGLELTGRWADDRGAFGRMGCNVTP